VSPNDLLRALTERVLLADGAMGTELQRTGLRHGACGELWNRDQPDRVLAVHRAYVDAGADVLLTNTFGGCRLALGRHGMGARVRELNSAAVALAREALAKRPGFVLGDMGPFGGMLEPHGDTAAGTVASALREQADALLEAGCDGIVVETQTSLEELALAVTAAKASGAKTVIASLSFDTDKTGDLVHTMRGVTPESAAEFLGSSGADVVGINCGARLDLRAAAKVLGRMGSLCRLPLFAKPNAGSPEIEAGRVVYRQSPESMATELEELLRAGARVVGGCCGTTPAHIRAFRGVLDSERA
jgi:5-methyltetrahydrofolate--homocysteine methyltransferase